MTSLNDLSKVPFRFLRRGHDDGIQQALDRVSELAGNVTGTLNADSDKMRKSSHKAVASL